MLRLMYKRVTCLDAPVIPHLDAEFDKRYQEQRGIEMGKFKDNEIKFKDIEIEYLERKARVEWFKDGDEHKDTLDRSRLLRRLPQLSRKQCKRGWSGSRSRAQSCGKRESRAIPCESPEVNSESEESFELEVVVIPSLERSVKIVDSPSDKVSLEVSSIQENHESESSSVPSAAESVSGDGLPIVTRSKDGQRTSCTYDEYLANQFGKDSSDDEVFELHVPLRTLESFLA